ncbi:hypothetical protein [Candidatus Borreliella tachyglossi]|uniref:hypothetical protein n=1 Tax=Candidatus Borreliella tachyglossi TaxID=1964448 RepID=UPI00404297D3
MRSLINYFLIVSLVVQVSACQRFNVTDDCSTCLYDTPRTIEKNIKDFVKDINKAINKEIENITKNVEKLVKESELDNDVEATVIRKGCYNCFPKCKCTTTIYKRKKKK